MKSDITEESSDGVERIITELHQRGVKSGKAESERIISQARLEAREILRQAEAEQARLVEGGEREAERIREAANNEAQQMLESFMASVPDIFAKRASRVLDAVLATSFDPGESSDTIQRFVSLLNGDVEKRLKTFFSKADPQSFIEGLVVLAVAFYAQADGFDNFSIDSRLQKSLARILGDPAFQSAVGYQFRDGIVGFRVDARDGREVTVSPECIKHMAEAWAGEEFRNIFAGLKVQDHPVVGA
jgi:F0F1-type ATP synthase membrane subunit b/b'